MKNMIGHIVNGKAFGILLTTLMLVIASTVCRAEQLDSCRQKPIITLRTNTLYDAFIIPNIGAEMQVGNGWAVQLDWFYTWFSSNNRHRYWQGYGGYVTMKRYFDFPRWNTSAPLTGHHVGIYISALTYDVEWGGKGYQASKFGFGGGVEYGYSCRVSRNMKMDFTLGLGFQDGEYKEYEPSRDHYNHYVWLATKKRHWWGPTKLEVSLAWFLGGKKKNKISIESVNPVDTIGNNRKGGGL